jgi:hypothetical protein
MHRMPLWGTITTALVFTLPVSADDEKASGTIMSYECGDNCYLTIKSKDGKEITALCVADGCAAWNEQAAMPEELIGQSVSVTIGTGQQYDGGGNLMGDFPAFTEVSVAKK